jgi:hypothetical protein
LTQSALPHVDGTVSLRDGGSPRDRAQAFRRAREAAMSPCHAQQPLRRRSTVPPTNSREPKGGSAGAEPDLPLTSHSVRVWGETSSTIIGRVGTRSTAFRPAGPLGDMRPGEPRSNLMITEVTAGPMVKTVAKGLKTKFGHPPCGRRTSRGLNEAAVLLSSARS